MAFDFTGKTAIVTGGTQGIGLEIAKGIVEGGGRVALIARNAAKGEAAVAELGEGNKFYQLDVADAPKARETVEQDLQGPAPDQRPHQLRRRDQHQEVR